MKVDEMQLALNNLLKRLAANKNTDDLTEALVRKEESSEEFYEIVKQEVLNRCKN